MRTSCMAAGALGAGLLTSPDMRTARSPGGDGDSASAETRGRRDCAWSETSAQRVKPAHSASRPGTVFALVVAMG
jgi:hypothetical protein